MDRSILELSAILVLILANGFFAASEFALIASRKSLLKNWARKGDTRAARTRDFIARPDKFLATIQVGITFVATLAGVFSGATLVQYLVPSLQKIPIEIIQNAAGPIAIGIVVIVISFLSIVIGELIPKYIALAAPEKIAILVTRPISIFSKLSFFVVTFLTGSARFILRIFGFSKTQERTGITEEEINILISEGIEKGVFDKTEQKLIKSVFDFSDITVRQSMTPRVDFISIRLDWPREKIVKVMTTHGYSRYPVFRESLDRIEGIIYTKDLISFMVHDEMIILKDIIRKPLFVPDSMPLTVLLRKFQKKKIHIAIVLDEFGGTAGLITLEDILEEIVGEIQDEHDTAQPEFVAHSDKMACVAASLRPDELNESFDLQMPEEISDTIGGFIIENLNHRPQLGDEVIYDKIQFKILEMDSGRIKRVQVRKL
ncbi:MAG: hemolysin family protein [candidate division Zixibacteria bacterium]